MTRVDGTTASKGQCFFFPSSPPYLNGELHYRCILVVKKQHDPRETPLVLLDSSIMVGTERPPCRSFVSKV